ALFVWLSYRCLPRKGRNGYRSSGRLDWCSSISLLNVEFVNSRLATRRYPYIYVVSIPRRTSWLVIRYETAIVPQQRTFEFSYSKPSVTDGPVLILFSPSGSIFKW